MTVTCELLTEHYLEFLILKGGYTGSSESTRVKMPHCLKHMMFCVSLDESMVHSFVSAEIDHLTK